MSTHRFYLPPEAWSPPDATLDEAESHHCLNVLRLAVDDRIILFDGQGRESVATISAVAKSAVSLRLGPINRTPKLRCEITLAQAIPKGKNMDLIVQKAVELGVSKIVPLVSDRAVVRIDESDADSKREKWTSVVIEAAKQCGQNWLPEVTSPLTPREFFATNPKADLMLVGSLQPDALPLKTLLREYSPANWPRSVIALIGPEGDFTPAELGLARSGGCRALSLGPIVLRTETAALYTLSILAHELQANPTG